jgi:hypothetical protein
MTAEPGWHDATLEKYGATDKRGNFDTSMVLNLNLIY